MRHILKFLGIAFLLRTGTVMMATPIMGILLGCAAVFFLSIAEHMYAIEILSEYLDDNPAKKDN